MYTINHYGIYFIKPNHFKYHRAYTANLSLMSNWKVLLVPMPLKTYVCTYSEVVTWCFGSGPPSEQNESSGSGAIRAKWQLQIWSHQSKITVPDLQPSSEQNYSSGFGAMSGKLQLRHRGHQSKMTVTDPEPSEHRSHERKITAPAPRPSEQNDSSGSGAIRSKWQLRIRSHERKMTASDPGPSREKIVSWNYLQYWFITKFFTKQTFELMS